MAKRVRLAVGHEAFHYPKDMQAELMDRSGGMPALATELVTQCLLCGTPGATLFQGLHDRLYSVEGEFGFARCACCGLVWQSPRPTMEDIPKCYPDDYEPHEGASAGRGPVRPAAGMRDAMRGMISERGIRLHPV